jgi:hypothetical protein
MLSGDVRLFIVGGNKIKRIERFGKELSWELDETIYV